MLNYLVIGANDVALSARFYEATLRPLGYIRHDYGEGLVRFVPKSADTADNPDGVLWVQKPFDGKPAVASNGCMSGFRAETKEEVDAVHRAALNSGGTDEGAPGTRPAYGDHFYVAYMRDPAGNKLAVFCML